MPIEIELKKIPAGYAESAARGGDTVKVSTFGFYSSEDGDELIRRLEGFPQQILSLIPSNIPILPSMVDTLLAIIEKDKTVQVYLNEAKLIAQVRVKKNVKKGEIITSDHILDMGRIRIADVTVPQDCGVIFVFSVGWRKGFLYDLTPLHGDPPKNRDYDLEELLGSLYSYLTFQERFKIDEQMWDIIFDQKWFPFSHLDNDLIKKMIFHAREGWNIDDLLPKILENIRRLLEQNNPTKKKDSYFHEHSKVFEKGFERYLDQDYISCVSILYPRIEGLLRSFYRAGGYKGKADPKKLSKAAINHHSKNRITHSLLIPSKFNSYLDNVYFASFSPGSLPEVSRHSVAHGEARTDDFNLKSATIAILTIYQLSLFMTGSTQEQT
jgi:hypothetical protein